MKLTFRLVEPINDIESWSHADEEDFRYRLVAGDLILEIGTKNFGTNWGWVPLIDLVAGLRQISKKLGRHGRTETFEFTESESWLRFSRQGDRVTITSSYSPGEAQIEYSRFVHAVENLSKELRSELLQRNPALAENPAFQRLLPEEVSE
jgi:hypothetical protein